MMLQELAESIKVGLDEESSLSSKLNDTTKLIEELRKEIEVTDKLASYTQLLRSHLLMMDTYVQLLQTLYV